MGSKFKTRYDYGDFFLLDTTAESALRIARVSTIRHESTKEERVEFFSRQKRRRVP